MSRLLRTVAATALVAVALGVGTASAEMTGDNQILYRKNVFRVMGANMKAISAIMKQEAGDAASLGAFADSLAAAAKAVGPALKPNVKGEAEQTKALPKIWEDEAKIAELVKTLQDETAKLAAVSGDMAAFGAQMGAVGKACKSCHDDYKEKQDEAKKM